MSSSGKTSNIGLSQFNGSDKPKWGQDYNADMRAIDAAFGGLGAETKTYSNANDIRKNGFYNVCGELANSNVPNHHWYTIIHMNNLGVPGYARQVAFNFFLVDEIYTRQRSSNTGNWSAWVPILAGRNKDIVLDNQARLRMSPYASIYSPGSQQLHLCASTENPYVLKYGVTNGSWGIHAHIDNQVNVGLPGYRMKNIYAGSGTINTSDRNMKKDIEVLDDDKTVAFVKGLRACQYKSVDGDSGRTHYGFVAQDVEELMQQLGMSSLDFAGFIKSPKFKMVEKEEQRASGEVDKEGNPIMETVLVPDTEEVPGEYTYGLRYEEFTPILWRYSQIMDRRQVEQDVVIELMKAQQTELAAKNAELEARLFALENR